MLKREYSINTTKVKDMRNHNLRFATGFFFRKKGGLKWNEHNRKAAWKKE